MVRGMAAGAGHPRMLALENISSEFVIESLGVPLDEWKILTVVLGMTAGTLIARALRNVVGSVQSLARGKPGCNFSVAVEAFERGYRTELVTSGAVGSASEELVRARKRTGRDLRPCRRQEPQQTKHGPSFEQKLAEPQRSGAPASPLNNVYGRFIKTG